MLLKQQKLSLRDDPNQFLGSFAQTTKNKAASKVSRFESKFLSPTNATYNP